MSHDAAGRLQTSWDARAAANFIAGGAGAGLIVFTAFAGVGGLALPGLMLGGLASIGGGLLCVWHELGRPRRALNVFLHPRTSWMSREAIVAVLLVPATVAAAAGVHACRPVAGVLALAFIVCQAGMLRGARAIPAWRAPLIVPLVVITGLVEGAGLFVAASAWLHTTDEALLAVFGALVLLRIGAWLAYRRVVATSAAPAALAALDAAARVLRFAGTLLPLALIALIAAGVIGGPSTLAVAAIAGIAAAASGAWLKCVLILRAGFMQAVALAHLPVRGVRP